MVKTPQDFPPRVSLFTNYAEKKVEVTVEGENGTLGLELYQEGPFIVIKDPDRGPMKLKAMCMLKANGHVRGAFAAEGGVDGRYGHLVWFPVKKKSQRQAKRRKIKQ